MKYPVPDVKDYCAKIVCYEMGGQADMSALGWKKSDGTLRKMK